MMSNHGSAGPSERLQAHHEPVWLPVTDLLPNPYNPNQMSQAEFNELVAEVAHLGRCPKPIIVRQEGAQWLIVDGEHGWRAAKEVGLPAVTCEVVEADDFEAMRQTYKRNQHGRHDPVRLGCMFRLMMTERGCSGRELATAIGVSEATIRNAILYAEATDLRNGYAVAVPSERVDVSGLTVRQVRAYVGLPPHIRDAWLDSGADPNALARAVVVRHDAETPGPTCVTDFSVTEEGGSGWGLLVDAGLAQRVQSSSFVNSAHEAFRLLLFRQEFLRAVRDLDEYLRPIVELCLPACLLNRLPAVTVDGSTSVVLTPAAWTSILRECMNRSSTPTGIDDLVRASVNMALRQAGVMPANTTDPRTLEALAVIDEAPPFLRASPLSLNDQYELAQLMSAWTGPQDELLAVGERACLVLHGTRRVPTTTAAGVTSGQRQRAMSATPAGAFDYARNAVRSERLHDQRRSALATRDDLVAMLADQITSSSPDGASADGLAMAGVLRERLRAVPLPELQLLGGLWLGVTDAATIWRESLLKGDGESTSAEHVQGDEG